MFQQEHKGALKFTVKNVCSKGTTKFVFCTLLNFTCMKHILVVWFNKWFVHMQARTEIRQELPAELLEVCQLKINFS